MDGCENGGVCQPSDNLADLKVNPNPNKNPTCPPIAERPRVRIRIRIPIFDFNQSMDPSLGTY